ncbi:hypothetical protein [Pseudomonas gregormendelii]
MQVLIFIALLIIIVLLAPWMLGVFAGLLAVWGVIIIPIAIVGGLVLIIGLSWIDFSGNPKRQQKRLEKRIKKMTDAANKANARKE